MPEEQATTNQLMGRFEKLSDRFDELMDFLKEHMVMRSDLENFMTKEEGRELRSEIHAVGDTVARLQQTLEIELLATKGRKDRLEDRIDQVENRIVTIEKKLELA